MKSPTTPPPVFGRRRYAITGALTGLSLPLALLGFRAVMPRPWARACLPRVPSQIARHLGLSVTAGATAAIFGHLLGARREARWRAEQHTEHQRDRFLAVVAHDFRDPIAAIVALTESIVRKAHADEVRVPVAVIERLEQLGWRLNRLVSDLSDATLIERGRLGLERSPVRLQQLVSRLARQKEIERATHPITVRYAGRPRPVSGDPARLEQVFANLIDNATKFSLPGTPIEVMIAAEPDGTSVRVTDHGHGISREELPRLFDRYYQATRARERKSGLGLGLYITKGIVEAHGGRLDVSSEVGVGSSFRVTLPALRLERSRQAPHTFNAVVTLRDKGFSRAVKALGKLGEVQRTGFYNVLTVRATDPQTLERRLREQAAHRPEEFASISGVVPVTNTFSFQTAGEFEERVRHALEPCIPVLAGRSFHVRLHRRGFKGQLSTQDEERRLGEYLRERLESSGAPGRVDFRDPDVIVVVETVGTQAGVSLWPREKRASSPLLHLD